MKKQNLVAEINQYGQSEVNLVERAIPEVQNNDVLVEVVAASVNPVDLKIIEGKLKLILKYKMPLKVGSDFSGKVVKVGSNVKNYQVGITFTVGCKRTGWGLLRTTWWSMKVTLP